MCPSKGKPSMIPYIPDFLLSSLREYDARYALFRFCAIWKVPYAPLMDPTSPDHASASEGLRCAIGFLADVEQTANHCQRDPGPIYDALYRSTEEAECLLGQLRRVSQVIATIRGVHLTFELVKRLAETALAGLRPWNLVSEEELLKAEGLAHKLREYEAQFGQADSRIQEALKRIGALGSRLKNASKKEYESLLARRGEILHDLRAGRDFEAKLEDFGCLAGLFSDLAKRATADVGSEQRSRSGRLTLSEAMATLGVQIGASFAEIKSAYRKLAKQFHPDRCPGVDSAKENMQRINAAYDYITDKFAGGMA
jgi:DnaJ-domain-containing protein 1